jgi:predicted ester cyclase
MGTAEENEAFIRRFGEGVWNQGNMALIDEFYAPDAVSQSGATYKRVITELRAAFPDLRLTYEQIVADSEHVAARVRITGTHQGHLRALAASDAVRSAQGGADHPMFLLDVAPTGRHMDCEGAAFFHIADGRIVSAWVLFNYLGLLRQLGSLPVPNRMSP